MVSHKSSLQVFFKCALRQHAWRVAASPLGALSCCPVHNVSGVRMGQECFYFGGAHFGRVAHVVE